MNAFMEKFDHCLVLECKYPMILLFLSNDQEELSFSTPKMPSIAS